MKVYLETRSGAKAEGEYNPDSKQMIVLKGAVVSKEIKRSPKFRSANTIEKKRKETVVDGILKMDVIFNSSSTAANFVTGSSKNGLVAWKDKDGKPLKQIITENQ